MGEEETKKSENTIIETHSLTKRYGDITAVDDLTLTIGRGEVFGLLGPNGAGKTTTTLMLLGLTEPTSGRALIDGHDCTREPIKVKEFVGYLPDNVGFYTDMTGRENLRFTGRLNGLSGAEIEKRSAELLERVGMTYAADRKTGTYSKGMRQRLGIADALMKDPKVIIMDEPTNGIDPEGMRELLALIGELAKRDGKTILVSSHQLYQVQQICDRVGIFVKGHLIACGRIDELSKQLNEEGVFTTEFMAAPCDDGLKALIAGLPTVRSVETEHGLFVITSTSDVRTAASKAAIEKGYSIEHVRQRGGDLDEIYRRYFEKAGDEDGSGNGEKKPLRQRSRTGKKDR